MPGVRRTAPRVPEVIDTWYDSGAMPFAQWATTPSSARRGGFDGAFPADFISEAIDQTRGWFYTLMAEGVLQFDATAYRNVVASGTSSTPTAARCRSRSATSSTRGRRSTGRARTRRAGSCSRDGSPWASRRVGHEVFDEVLRRFLLTLWNVYAFFVTYANAEGFDPRRRAPPPVERPVARPLGAVATRAHRRGRARRPRCLRRDRRGPRDQGVRRRPVQLVRAAVPAALLEPGRQRPGRRDAAFHTLYECLVTVATLLAPFTPFVAEELWRNLAAGRDGRPDSVHLADYPDPDDGAERRRARRGDGGARADRGARPHGPRRHEDRSVRQPLRGGRRPLRRRPRRRSQPLLERRRRGAEREARSCSRSPRTGSAGGGRSRTSRCSGRGWAPSVKGSGRGWRDDDGTLAGALADGDAVTVPDGAGEVVLSPETSTSRRTCGRAGGWRATAA